MSTSSLSHDDFTAWLSSLTDTQVLAITLLGEARGEDILGRQMVAASVMNRVAHAQVHQARIGAPFWWGADLRSVVLKPWQYSCWNESDPNRAKLPSLTSHPLWSEAMAIADTAVAGRLIDRTQGADSYLNPDIVKLPPKWAVPSRMTAQHLHHQFYRTV